MKKKWKKIDGTDLTSIRESKYFKMLPKIYPVHSTLLVRDLQDPTLGGHFAGSEEDPAEADIVHGLVVRAGAGFITKEGLIPLITKEGDNIVFFREHGIELKHQKGIYFLIEEDCTSAIFDRDPYEEDRDPKYDGVDIDAILDGVDKEKSP